MANKYQLPPSSKVLLQCCASEASKGHPKLLERILLSALKSCNSPTLGISEKQFG